MDTGVNPKCLRNKLMTHVAPVILRGCIRGVLDPRDIMIDTPVFKVTLPGGQKGPKHIASNMRDDFGLPTETGENPSFYDIVQMVSSDDRLREPIKEGIAMFSEKILRRSARGLLGIPHMSLDQGDTPILAEFGHQEFGIQGMSGTMVEVRGRYVVISIQEVQHRHRINATGYSHGDVTRDENFLGDGDATGAISGQDDLPIYLITSGKGGNGQGASGCCLLISTWHHRNDPLTLAYPNVPCYNRV